METENRNLPTTGFGTGLALTTFEDAWRFSKCVAASGLAPRGLEKPEAVVIAVQLGAEIGLSPMAALQNIAVINGRPGIYGDAALALVRASGLLADYSETLDGEGDDKGYTVSSLRKGMSAPLVTSFTVADAKRAKLWGKPGPWSDYPGRMLKFRARGFNLRDNFGDVLKGLRTTEELADLPIERNVTAEGSDATVAPENPIAKRMREQAGASLSSAETIVDSPDEGAALAPATNMAPANDGEEMESDGFGNAMPNVAAVWRAFAPDKDTALRFFQAFERGSGYHVFNSLAELKPDVRRDIVENPDDWAARLEDWHSANAGPEE